MTQDQPTRYIGRCVDPIHIGDGGYRLGRLDNAIVREPATEIPYIPGSSLAGVIRANYEQLTSTNTRQYFGDMDQRGQFRFYDGKMVLFPIPSSEGPIWISTATRIRLISGLVGNLEITEPQHEIVNLKGLKSAKVMVGWLSLPVTKLTGDGSAIQAPIDQIQRIGVVSDKLFQVLVNDHLEVRTSVKIDSETGTAADGALFTYEAIPAETWIVFEIGGAGQSKDVLKPAIDRMALTGIGGLTTRGMGRFKCHAISNAESKAGQ